MLVFPLSIDKTEAEYNELEKLRAKTTRAELMASIKALQEAAGDSGA